MGLVDSILANSVIGLNNIFLATNNEQPSIYPQFPVLITIEEANFDLLVRGLVTVELYHVRLDPVQLGPNATLVRIPNGFITADHANPNAVI